MVFKRWMMLPTCDIVEQTHCMALFSLYSNKPSYLDQERDSSAEREVGPHDIGKGPYITRCIRSTCCHAILNRDGPGLDKWTPSLYREGGPVRLHARHQAARSRSFTEDGCRNTAARSPRGRDELFGIFSPAAANHKRDSAQSRLKTPRQTPNEIATVWQE